MGVGTSGGRSYWGGLEPNTYKQDQNHSQPRNGERGEPKETLNRHPEFEPKNMSANIPSAPWFPQLVPLLLDCFSFTLAAITLSK